MAEKRNKIITLVVLILFFVFTIWHSTNKYNDIQKNAIISISTVLSVNMDARGNPCIRVSFSYESQDYISDHCITGLSYQKCKKELIGIKVPIIFSSKNPVNGDLLINEFNFNRYNLQMPDSSKILFDRIKSWL